MTAVLVLMFIGLVWIAPIPVAHSIGKPKGREGWLWGFSLGWIGVLIVLLRAPRKPSRAQAPRPERMNGNLRIEVAHDAKSRVRNLIAESLRLRENNDYRACEPLEEAFELAVREGDAGSVKEIAHAARRMAAAAPNDIRLTPQFLSVAERAEREAAQTEREAARIEREPASPEVGEAKEMKLEAVDPPGGHAPLPPGHGLHHDDAERIARERYAKGEIGREEFLQIRHDLRDTPAQTQ